MFSGLEYEMGGRMLESGRIWTFHVVFPILIILGVLSSAVSIVVLRRPALSSLQVNKKQTPTKVGRKENNAAIQYFQILMWCDMAFFVSLLPIVVNLAGCSFTDYWSTWVYAHVGWSLPNALHCFCAYILAWLALDRCLAVWYHPGYTFIQKPMIQMLRVFFTAVLCGVMNVPFMLTGEVECTSWNETETRREDDPECKKGSWLSNDGYQNNFDQTWHKIFRGIYGCVVWWGPGVMLLVFNLSLVVAVLLGRVRSYARSQPGEKGTLAKTWERNLVGTMIAMATSFLALMLPLAVFLMFFAHNKPDRCYISYPEDVLVHVADCFFLLEHLLHSFFLLCLIPNYRKELRFILCIEDKYTQTSIVDVTHDSGI